MLAVPRDTGNVNVNSMLLLPAHPGNVLAEGKRWMQRRGQCRGLPPMMHGPKGLQLNRSRGGLFSTPPIRTVSNKPLSSVLWSLRTESTAGRSVTVGLPVSGVDRWEQEPTKRDGYLCRPRFKTSASITIWRMGPKAIQRAKSGLDHGLWAVLVEIAL